MTDSAGPYLLALLALGATAAGLGFLARYIAARTNLGARDYSNVDLDTMVTVAAFSSAIEAHLWRERLRAAGVRCMVVGDISHSYMRFPNLFGPSIRLQVLAKDAPRAQHVLSGR